MTFAAGGGSPTGGTDAPSPADSKTRILNAAIAQIDAGGEASVRVLDIADVAAVSPSLIYHHFANRDGLVAAAQARRYSFGPVDDVAIFIRTIEGATSRADAASSLTAGLTSVVSRERAPVRLRRLSALAATHGRPELRVELSETVAELMDSTVGFIELGQSKQIFRTDLDARAMATVLLSTASGFVAADLDAAPASQDDLRYVLRIIVESFYEPSARSAEPPPIDPDDDRSEIDGDDIESSSGEDRPTPAGRSSDGVDARDRILNAAIETIDRDGDAALRVVAIAKKAKVVPAMINYHFGSREGLVAAALQERFKLLVGSGTIPFSEILNSDRPPREKADAYRSVFMTSVSRDRAPMRLKRASAVAAIQGRPDLEAMVSDNVALFIDDGEQLVRLGQQTGVFRSDVDARAAGTVVMGLGFGLIVADFDARPASEDDLRDVLGSLIGSLFRR
jgi:AcrR family transcriptional regulator